MSLDVPPALGRLLITGADGFVGTWFIRRLKAQMPADWRLFGLVQQATEASDGLERCVIDITQPGSVDQAVASIKPTCVVHLAAIAAISHARSDPRHTWAVNLDGTRYLAEAVLRHTPRARFVFVGTSEVYGGSFNAWSGRPLDETALLDPTNPYASSKAAADLLIGQMCHDGLQAVRFRPFNHAGPGQSEAFVIPAFAAQIVRIERGLQEPVLRVGNLDAERDFLDVRDVVDAYARAVFKSDDSNSGRVFNLASGYPRRIGDLLQNMIALSEAQIEIEIDRARLRPNDTPRAIGNSQHARDILGWEPAVEWQTTLKGVLDSFRAAKPNPD